MSYAMLRWRTLHTSRNTKRSRRDVMPPWRDAMPDPALRDRLIEIIVGAIIDGGPLGDHPPNIADALLASEFGEMLKRPRNRSATCPSASWEGLRCAR